MLLSSFLNVIFGKELARIMEREGRGEREGGKERQRERERTFMKTLSEGTLYFIPILIITGEAQTLTWVQITQTSFLVLLFGVWAYQILMKQISALPELKPKQVLVMFVK